MHMRVQNLFAPQHFAICSSYLTISVASFALSNHQTIYCYVELAIRKKESRAVGGFFRFDFVAHLLVINRHQKLMLSATPSLSYWWHSIWAANCCDLLRTNNIQVFSLKQNAIHNDNGNKPQKILYRCLRHFMRYRNNYSGILSHSRNYAVIDGCSPFALFALDEPAVYVCPPPGTHVGQTIIWPMILGAAIWRVGWQ